MTVHDHGAAEASAPGEKRLLNPCPVISAERGERRRQGYARLHRWINAAMDEERIADAHAVLERLKLRKHFCPGSLAQEFARQCCVLSPARAPKLIDEGGAIDLHPLLVSRFRKA